MGAAAVTAPLAPKNHNMPPVDVEPTGEASLRPYEAIKAHIEDLYTEARAWMDGEPIATGAQADEVARLLDLIRQAHSAADEARVLENKPFDDGKAEVQGRYAPLIADTKALKGKTVLALAALKDAQTAWLRKLEAERQAEAKRLRDIADAELAQAQEALRAAHATTDLSAREDAETLLTEAKATDLAATRAEHTKAHAQGEFRAVGLRSYWTPAIANPVEALRWAWASYRPQMEAFALDLAKAEVRAGKRSLPGFTITEERRV